MLPLETRLVRVPGIGGSEGTRAFPILVRIAGGATSDRLVRDRRVVVEGFAAAAPSSRQASSAWWVDCLGPSPWARGLCGSDSAVAIVERNAIVSSVRSSPICRGPGSDYRPPRRCASPSRVGRIVGRRIEYSGGTPAAENRHRQRIAADVCARVRLRAQVRESEDGTRAVPGRARGHDADRSCKRRCKSRPR